MLVFSVDVPETVCSVSDDVGKYVLVNIDVLVDVDVRFSDVEGICEEDVLLVEDEEVEDNGEDDDMLVELDVCEKGVVVLEELADDMVVGDIVEVVGVTNGEELDSVLVLVREEDKEEGCAVVTFVVSTCVVEVVEVV